VIPDKFLYAESRELFLNPDVIRDKAKLEKLIVFDKPNEEELKQWLIHQKGFAETKVINGLEKLVKCQKKKNQCRLDNFFKQSTIVSSKTEKAKAPAAPKGRGRGRGKCHDEVDLLADYIS
jgi:flap endonuclease-1